MTLVQSVQEQVSGPLVVGGCSKQGCKVPLKNTPQPRLVLDLDKPGSPLGKNETRCDCDFTPALAGSGFHGNVKKTSAKRKIQFGQGEALVELMGCGKPLAEALDF